MTFDIRPFESKCFISDLEWKMIIESESYKKIGNYYYAVYKNNVLQFNILSNGLVLLLNRKRKPSKDYTLPPDINLTMPFLERLEIYKKEHELSKGLSF